MFKAPVPKFSEDPAPPPPPPPPSTSAEAGPKDGSHGVAAQKLAYEQPDWKGVPQGIPYAMEIIKGGVHMKSLDLCDKSCYTFGRQPDCDVVLDHPSSSRVHAVVQYRKDGASFIYDNKSTHGTFINKSQLKPKVYAPLRVGDVLRFGQSSRLYIFQGPSELMPAQEPSKGEALEIKRLEAEAERKAKAIREEARGGLGEDLSDLREEEAQALEGEVDWRAKYEKGQLTEKQSTIAERIRKKERTMANLKSEVERISVKESSQQLSEGQQMQMARNQKRLQQLQEEIDEAEGILLDSMNESRFANSKTGSAKKRKHHTYGEDGTDSDEDDAFYDRTEKKKKKVRGRGKGKQQAETIESLWERHGTLSREKESLTRELQEKVQSYRQSASTAATAAATAGATNEADDDSLDAYLVRMKNQAKQDQISKLERSLAKVHQELTRAESLIKIADPMGTFKALHHFAVPTAVPTAGSVEPERNPVVNLSPSPSPTVSAKQKDEFKAPEPIVRPPAVKTASLSVVKEEVKRKSGGDVSTCGKKDQDQDYDSTALDLINILQGAHRGAVATDDLAATDNNQESTWMPPSGQSGDGTTSLNKRLGY